MIHEIKTSPAYDMRDQTPNYGQHPLEFHFVTRSNAGALVFTLTTGWYIEQQKRAQIGSSGSFQTTPKSEYCSLVFHKVATLQDCVDEDPTEHCGWIDGPCIAHEPYGGIGRQIGDLFMVLIRGGLENLWQEMDKLYKEITK